MDEFNKYLLSNTTLEHVGTSGEFVEVFMKSGIRILGQVVRFTAQEIAVQGGRKDGTSCLTIINRELVTSICVSDKDGGLLEKLSSEF